MPSGLVHYWFSGKDELLEAVVEDMLGSFETAANSPTDVVPDDELFSMLRAAFRVVEEDDRGRQIAAYELTTWALRHQGLEGLASGQYRRTRSIAQAGIDHWRQRVGLTLGVPDAQLAQLITAIFDGLVLAWLADPEGTDVDGTLRLLSSLLEGTLRAPGAAPAANPADQAAIL